MPTTRVTVHVPVSPARVYAALVDPAAAERWRVPDGMQSQVHGYDARVGADVELIHEGVPAGVPAKDDEAGTRMALTRLAAYVREHPSGQG